MKPGELPTAEFARALMHQVVRLTASHTVLLSNRLPTPSSIMAVATELQQGSTGRAGSMYSSNSGTGPAAGPW